MITLKNVVLRRGTKVILDSASVTLNPGENVGLVGRNGAGKSSLFAMLNGTLHEDGGEFYIPAQWRMAQVAQDMPETEQSATDYVIEGDIVLTAAQAEVTAAEASGDGDRMAHAYMELYDSGAHDSQARAQALILGLGFKVSELDNPVNSFSGGWRMRLQLARALMCPSDLLLLDEPTNHLDLDALVWLEAWLKKYQGTMLVISHDREFLDAVTNVTVHIESAKLTRYGGNYSKFEDLRAEQMALQQTLLASSKTKLPTCKSLSPASKPRPARPNRRKAASRRWTAWRKSRRCWPKPTSPSNSKNPPTCPTPCCRCRMRSLATRPLKTHPKARRPPSSCATSTNPCWPASALAFWVPTARVNRRW